MKKYQIIYIDCPWGAYKDKARAGKRGAEFKYPCMSMKEICALPINELADKNCFLFSWSTFPLLQEGLNAIKSWGFKYKTNGFLWEKTNKKAKDTLFWGGGSYSRANPEPCLLATKGKPKVISHSVHSIVRSPISKHSEKPAMVRDRILELCGDLPRIEIFSRHIIDGWDVFGNDPAVINSENFVDIFKYKSS